MNNEYLQEAMQYFDVTENISKKELRALFRKKAKVAHPDKGGTEEEFVKLNEMYEYLLRYIDYKTECENNNKEENSEENDSDSDEKSTKQDDSPFSENNNNFDSNEIIKELQEILSNLNLSKKEVNENITRNINTIIFYVEHNVYNLDDKVKIYEYLSKNADISPEDIKRGFKKYNKNIRNQYLFIHKYTILFLISLGFTIASLTSAIDAITSSNVDTYYWFPIQVVILLVLAVLKLYWLPSFVWVNWHRLNIRQKSLAQTLSVKKKTSKGNVGYLIIIIALLICIVFVIWNILLVLNIASPHYDANDYDSSNLISAHALLSEVDTEGLSVDYIGKIKRIEETKGKIEIEVRRPYLFPEELGNNYVSQPLVLEIDEKSDAYSLYLIQEISKGDFINFKGVITGLTDVDGIGSGITKISVSEIYKLSEQDAIAPTLETYTASESLYINGIEFSDLKIELSPLDTRVSCTVINNTDQVFIWDPYSSLLIVDGVEYTFGAEYMPTVPYEIINLRILPGKSSTGIIQFPAIDSSIEHEITWDPNIGY